MNVQSPESKVQSPDEVTLETVRELSEKATLRPAPRKLHCIPVREFVLKPVSIAAKRIFGRIQVALLMEEIARDLKQKQFSRVLTNTATTA